MKSIASSGVESWHEQYESVFKRLKQTAEKNIDFLKQQVQSLEDDLLQHSVANFNSIYCRRELSFRFKRFQHTVASILDTVQEMSSAVGEGKQGMEILFIDEKLSDLNKSCVAQAGALCTIALKLCDTNLRQKTLMQRELIRKDSELKTLQLEMEYLKSRLQQEEHRANACEKLLSSSKDTKGRRKSIFQDEAKSDLNEELQYFREQCQNEISNRVEFETKLEDVKKLIESSFNKKPPMKDDEAVRVLSMFFRTYFYTKRWRTLVEQYVKSVHSKELKHRNHVVKEIVGTEKNYVDYLDALVKNIYHPLHKSSILRIDELNDIFSNLPNICEIHRTLREKMEVMFRNWPTHPLRMGECFLEIAPFLSVYTQYINNYNKSSKIIQVLHQKNPQFSVFVKKMESDPACYRQSLESILIMPIQRVPRYILLLEQLLKHTPTNHREHEKLIEAIQMCKALGEKINESKREREMQDRLEEANAFIMDDAKILTNGRVCYHSGNLKILDKECAEVRCYLFNDCLLVASPVEKEKYRIRGCLLMENLVASVVPQTFPIHPTKLEKIFEITWTGFNSFQDRGLFMCNNVEDRNIWIQEINKAHESFLKNPTPFTPSPPLDRNRSPYTELDSSTGAILTRPVSMSLSSTLSLPTSLWGSRRKSTVSQTSIAPQEDIIIQNYDFLSNSNGVGPLLPSAVGMSQIHSSAKICGYMYKQGSIRSNSWKNRWFVLDDVKMHYYKSQPTSKETKPSISFSLASVTLTPCEDDSDKFFNFNINHKHFVSMVACDTWNELRAWSLFILNGYEGVVHGKQMLRRTTASSRIELPQSIPDADEGGELLVTRLSPTQSEMSITGIQDEGQWTELVDAEKPLTTNTPSVDATTIDLLGRSINAEILEGLSAPILPDSIYNTSTQKPIEPPSVVVDEQEQELQ